jgi:uncharacterized membrane protein YfcA
MTSLPTGDVVVIAVAFLAAMVTGALGYGFSSITVPVALLFVPGKTLAPALVLLELATNLLGLMLHRREVPSIARRIAPIIAGLLPGVALGAWLLSSVSGSPIKIATYAALLPLVVAQSTGRRWPLRRERAAAIPAGVFIGALYSATTISGPPIALFLNNQGLAQRQFRAAVYALRAVESTATTVAYGFLGLFAGPSLHLSLRLTPSLLIGLPLGMALLRRIEAEAFRRVSMAVSATVIAFGLARSLIDVGVVAPSVAYAGTVGIATIELALLTRYFQTRHRVAKTASTAPG